MERLSIGATMFKALFMALFFTTIYIAYNYFKRKRECKLREQPNTSSIFAFGENKSTLTNDSNSLEKLNEIDLYGRKVGSIKEPLGNINFNDEIFYEIIAEELENNSLIKPLWVQAFASAEGDQNKAKSNYIKLRFIHLKRERDELKEKQRSIKEKELQSILNTEIKLDSYKTIGNLFESAKKKGSGLSHGYSNAKYLLAKLFQEGRCIAQDLESAKRWLIRAADEGYSAAISELAEIEMELSNNSIEAKDRIHIWSNDINKRNTTRKCWKCGDIYHGSEYVKCLKCNLYLKEWKERYPART